jgi:hypothetical protein
MRLRTSRRERIAHLRIPCHNRSLDLDRVERRVGMGYGIGRGLFCLCRQWPDRGPKPVPERNAIVQTPDVSDSNKKYERAQRRRDGRQCHHDMSERPKAGGYVTIRTRELDAPARQERSEDTAFARLPEGP